MKQNFEKLHPHMWQTHVSPNATPNRVSRLLLPPHRLNRFPTFELTRTRLPLNLRVESIHGEHGMLNDDILAHALVPLPIRHP